MRSLGLVRVRGALGGTYWESGRIYPEKQIRNRGVAGVSMTDGAGRVHPIRLARPASDNPEVLGRLSVKCMPPNSKKVRWVPFPRGRKRNRTSNAVGPQIDPSGSAPVSFEVSIMAEKLCAVLKTIGGTRCDNAAIEGDADGLCKQHRAQITNFGARAWAVYAGFASHFKHVAGDDAPVPSASKTAPI